MIVSVMTIHYFKSSGEIYATATGEQHIEIMYGSHAEDFLLILDEIIIPFDEFVLRNSDKFKVNIDTKEIEMLPQKINTYTMASQ